MWSVILSKLKEIFKRMIGNRTIEQELHIAPAISSEMENAITLWDAMYKNQAPWIREPDFNNPVRVVSLGIPSMIASEKARMTLIELESEITAPTIEVEKPNPNYVSPQTNIFAPGEDGSSEGFTSPLNPLAFQPETIVETEQVGNPERADFLNEQYKVLKEQHLRKQLEYGIAKGGFVIKPYPIEVSKNQMLGETVDPEDKGKQKPGYKFVFDFIQADAFYPLSFDASGNATEAAFIQTRVEQNIVYRRLEYHKWENDTVTIINKAYKASQTNDLVGSGVDLGQEVPLSEVPEWAELDAETTIANVSRPLFAYFRMPEANTIDTKSPLGVSGYSRAVSLIKDADMQYSRLLWEYEAGEMAVNIDRSAFNFMTDPSREDTKAVLGSMQNRLYRKVDVDTTTEIFEPYAPTLRDTQYIQGLNAILMRIEDATGLSRGTLSDVAAEARTATELKILKQRSYSVNAEIQKALETTLRDVIYIMNVYCDLYSITPDGDYDVSFEWDDSILVDVDRELNKRLTLYQNGLESKLEIRKWYFGETERQAREALAKITEEQLTSVDTPEMMTVGQYNPKMNGGEKR